MKRLLPPMALMLAFAALFFTAATPEEAPEPDAVTRGVALGMFATDPDYDYAGLLGEVRERGATDVLIVVNWYQDDARAHAIVPLPGKSPTDENVARTLRQAKSLGMRAALMPVVRLERREANEWRGVIAPEAGADAWFDSYTGFLSRMTAIARAERAERLVVGSELASMVVYENHWRDLIARTRQGFDGELLYSANWDNYERVPFWDALDVVGVTGYFELARPGKVPTDADLIGAWRGPRRDLTALRASAGKPVILTEIGYAAHAQAAARPWDEHELEDGARAASSRAPSLALQARLYAAFCDAMAPSGAVDGFYFWNWFGFGGPADASYTPRGKPAATHMEACLRRKDWRSPGSFEETRDEEN